MQNKNRARQTAEITSTAPAVIAIMLTIAVIYLSSCGALTPGVPVVGAPSFSLAEGTYFTSQTVSISSSTDDVEIYYTTDGSPPSSDTTLYGGAVTVDQSMTLRAVAVKSGWVDSRETSAVYAITGTIAAPAFSLEAGAYSGSQSLTLSCSTDGAEILYTTDGTDPAAGGAAYTGSITLDETMTVKAVAQKTDWQSSPLISRAYEIVQFEWTDVGWGVYLTDYIGTDADVVVPATVGAKVVGSLMGTFEDDTSVATVTISSGITSIGNSAFKNATAITDITIPDTVTNIDSYAFEGTTFTSIDLPDSIETIGFYIFYNAGIESLDIPPKVTSLGGICRGCTDLTSVKLPNGLTAIDGYSFQSTGLTSVAIPSGVTDIQTNAFGFSSLAFLTLPANLETIGTGAFYGIDITTVTIPTTVTSIGDSAFEGCSNLNLVTSKASSPATLGNDAFRLTATDLEIWVHSGRFSLYESRWSQYVDKLVAYY